VPKVPERASGNERAPQATPLPKGGRSQGGGSRSCALDAVRARRMMTTGGSTESPKRMTRIRPWVDGRVDLGCDGRSDPATVEGPTPRGDAGRADSHKEILT